MFDAIVCGSLHLDIMVRAPRLPALDETLPGSAWGQQCGGKGGNQAVMVARMGARCAMIGRVGADAFGRRLVDNLVEAGVDASAVTVDPASGSGMSVAIVDVQGDYGAVIVSGANLVLPPDGVAAAWDGLGGAAVLVLQNEVPEPVNIALAGHARASGARVILNAAPARAMSAALRDQVDILVVNRVEAAMVADAPVRDADEALTVLDRLTQGGRAALITLGADGVVGREGDGAPFLIAGLPVAVRSTHGAGDAFIGALAARLARGDTLETAARVANAAAAAHVAGQATTV